MRWMSASLLRRLWRLAAIVATAGVSGATALRSPLAAVIVACVPVALGLAWGAPYAYARRRRLLRVVLPTLALAAPLMIAFARDPHRRTCALGISCVRHWPSQAW